MPAPLQKNKKIKISSQLLQAVKSVLYLEGVHSRRVSFLCGNDHHTLARQLITLGCSAHDGKSASCSRGSWSR